MSCGKQQKSPLDALMSSTTVYLGGEVSQGRNGLDAKQMLQGVVTLSSAGLDDASAVIKLCVFLDVYIAPGQ